MWGPVTLNIESQEEVSTTTRIYWHFQPDLNQFWISISNLLPKLYAMGILINNYSIAEWNKCCNIHQMLDLSSTSRSQTTTREGTHLSVAFCPLPTNRDHQRCPHTSLPFEVSVLFVHLCSNNLFSYLLLFFFCFFLFHMVSFLI